MDSVWLEKIFNGIFGPVEVHFGGSEKFRPNGLSLVHIGFSPSILTHNEIFLVMIKIFDQMT